MAPELSWRALVVLATAELWLARATGGPLPAGEITLWATGWLLVGSLVALPRLAGLVVPLAAVAVGAEIAVPPVEAAWGAGAAAAVALGLAGLVGLAVLLDVGPGLVAVATPVLAVGAAALPGEAVPPPDLVAVWAVVVGVLAGALARPGGVPIGAVVAVLGAALPTPRPGTAADRPDVVLVTVDALRADAAPPSFARVARRGQAYEAWAAAPWTLPSLAAVLTGVPPHASGVGRVADGPFVGLDPSALTLAERLRAAGWDTLALSAGSPFTGHRYGLAQGFARTSHPWDHAAAPLPRGRSPHADARPAFARALARPPRPDDADGLVTATLAALANPDRRPPTFVWLHLMELHLPWADTPCRADVLAAPGVRPRLVPDPWWRTDEGRACLRAGYERRVARVEQALDRLVDGLDLDRTVLVLTSDHGEALGDAGVEHGHTLDPAVTRVPLVVAAPGRRLPVVPGPVSGTDVGATIEGLLGLERRLPGLDLSRATRAGPTVLSGTLYGPARVAVVDGPWMLERGPSGLDLRRWDRPTDLAAPDEVRARLAAWLP